MFSRAIVVLISLLSVSSFAEDRVHMVLEMDPWGHVSHRAADFSAPIGEGLDPVMQFILLDAPADDDIAQVLWEASETPVPWIRDAKWQSYHFVEHAVLPDGGRIDYRVYPNDSDFDLREFRHSRREADEDFYIDSSVLDSLPDGKFKLMAQLKVPGRPMQVMTQEIVVMSKEAGFELVEEIAPEVPPALPSAAESEDLTPGNGWTDPTLLPKQIGQSHEPAIAHWNVVPEQQIGNGFTVGVIAHHLDGIDYVEISANNGPWVRINNPSTNPRTNCEEYWTTLDLRGHNGKVELRAIAVPIQGKPVLVTPLGGLYGKQDLTLYTSVVGAVLELDAGEHNLNRVDLPEKGWLIVRPKPGVAREDVVLVGESQNWREGRLKLENLTIKAPAGNNTMRGRYQAGSITGQHVWFDRCRIIGNGPERTTAWLAFMWETATYTGCEISEVQNVFHGYRGIDTMVRNVHVHNTYEDVFRSGGLYVNVKIENLSREPMVQARNLEGSRKPHPDIWQFKSMSNSIAQDITAVNNINAQGFFPHNSTNVALVRVNIDTVSPYRAIQMMGSTKNVLIENSRFAGGAGFRGSVVAGERLVFRDTVAGSSPPYLPDGWESEGIFIFPKPGAAE